MDERNELSRLEAETKRLYCELSRLRSYVAAVTPLVEAAREYQRARQKQELVCEAMTVLADAAYELEVPRVDSTPIAEPEDSK